MNKTITLLILGVILLALLLMVLNTFKLEERQSPPALLPEKTRPHEGSTAARVPAEDSVPALAPPALEARSNASLVSPPQLVSPQPAQGAVLEPVPVVIKTVPAQIDAGHTDPPPPPVSAIAESKGKQRGAKNITHIVVYATQEGATLRLGGDAPLACTAMLLRSPDRLALDCPGQWNVNAPGVPQNKFIKAIRVGRQTDATRLVVDLLQAPASYRVVQTSPRGIDVRLR